MSLKEQIAAADVKYREARTLVLSLRSKCKDHVYIKTSGNGARCDICGQDGGWYCPDSPNHACDYERYDPEMGGHYSDYDECIHCGEPEERK